MTRIKCDLRTHTFFTAGADSTIKDNIDASAESGIELLALTDSISALCLESDEEFDEDVTISEADSESDDRFASDRTEEDAQTEEAALTERNAQTEEAALTERTVKTEDVVLTDDDSDSQPEEDFFLRNERGVKLLYGCEADIVSPEGYLLGVGLPITGSSPLITSGIRTDWGSSPEVGDKRLMEVVPNNEVPPIPGGMDFIIAGVNPKWARMKISKGKATRMYINVISDRRVLMLGNLCRTDLEYDMDEVLKTCKALNKPVEIDELSFEYGDEAALRIKKLLIRCAELGVMICADSGAMRGAEVGMIPRLSRELEETGFPESLIMNIDSATFLTNYYKAGFPVINF